MNRSFKELLSDYLIEALSQAELEHFYELLQLPENKTLLAQVIDEKVANREFFLPENDSRTKRMLDRLDDALQELNRQQAVLQMHSVHFLRTAWFRYAAAIILFLGIGSYWWLNNKRNEATKIVSVLAEDRAPGSEKAILTLANGEQITLNSVQGDIIRRGNLTVTNLNGKLDYKGKENVAAYHTLSTPRGGQYKIQLPDGTVVWLNAASSITYPTSFTEKERTVSITGEAYFEVAKDPTKIFTVKINQEEIVVLGTSFNVNSYPDESAVKTSLLEGTVRINNRLLKPGEAYINGKIVPTDLDVDLAWKNGHFHFDHTDMDIVLRQLSRWYDIDITYRDGKWKKEISGEMGRDLTLSEALGVLKRLGINGAIEGEKLTVFKK